jgi:integrase
MRARVYKRNGGKWYLDYTDHTGKPARPWAEEARTKDDAQKALRRALTREARIRTGEIEPLDNSASVAELLEASLLHKLATRRYATVAFYRAAFADALGRFQTPEGKVWPPEREVAIDVVRKQERRFEVGRLEATRVDQITRERGAQYIEAARRGRSVRTLNKTLVALKTLLEWARKAGRIRSDPLAEMSRVGKPGKGYRALDVDEVERLLDVSPEPYGTMWLAFVTTGMRRGELVKLRWSQVDCAIRPPER